MSLQWQLKAPWLPSDCCRFLPIENGRDIQSGRIFLGVSMSRCFPIEHGREIHVNSYAPGHGEWKYKEPLFAVAIAHCSLATSLVSRSTLIYHCLWRSEKKNGWSPSQTLSAHLQPLRFHEVYSSSIVFGGLYVQHGICTKQSSTNGISFSEKGFSIFFKR